MLSKLNKKAQGFTIIEVLIVLAIAGLILLIVFLAVPALQRNSRNTQRRNDVATVLGAVQEWQNNNPSTLVPNPVNGTGCANGVSHCAQILALAKRGSYTDANNFSVVAAGNGTPTNTTTVTTVVIATGALCNGTGATSVNATGRSVVLLYSVEGSNGSAIPQCQES